MKMLPIHKREYVRIHYDKGPSFEGVLVARYKDAYILKRASLLQGEDAHIDLEGPIEVLRERVLFIERIRESA
jgi:hypothetical protein